MGKSGFQAQKDAKKEDPLKQLNPFLRDHIYETARALGERGASKEQQDAFLDFARDYCSTLGEEMPYFNFILKMMEKEDFDFKHLNKEFLEKGVGMMEGLHAEVGESSARDTLTVALLSLKPRMFNEEYFGEMLDFAKAASKEKASEEWMSSWRILGRLCESDPVLMEKTVKNFGKAGKLARELGLGSEFETVVNLAYGMALLGEKKMLTLNKECGITHFMRYSKKTMDEVAKNLGKPKEGEAKPVLLVIAGKADPKHELYEREGELEGLTRGYRLVVVEAGNENEFYGKMGKVAEEQGKIETLLVWATGKWDRIMLGDGGEEASIGRGDREELGKLRDCFVRSEIPKAIIDVDNSGEWALNIASLLSREWQVVASAPSGEKTRTQYYFDLDGRIFQVNFRKYEEDNEDIALTKQYLEGRLFRVLAEPGTVTEMFLTACERAGLDERQSDLVVGTMLYLREKGRDDLARAFAESMFSCFMNENFDPKSVNRMLIGRIRRALEYTLKNEFTVMVPMKVGGVEGVVPTDGRKMLLSALTYVFANKGFDPKMLDVEFIGKLGGVLKHASTERSVYGAAGITALLATSPQFLESMDVAVEHYDEARKKLESAGVQLTAENIFNYAYALATVGKKDAATLRIRHGITYFLRYSPKTLKEITMNMDKGHRAGDPVLLVAYGKGSMNSSLYDEGLELEKLTKGYKVIVVEVNGEEDFFRQAHRVARDHGKINTLVLGGAGQAERILFGEPVTEKGEPNPDGVLNARNSAKLARLKQDLDYSSEMPTVVLSAALVGRGMDRVSMLLSGALNARSFAPDAVITQTNYHLDGKGRIARVTYETRNIVAWKAYEAKPLSSKEYKDGRLASESTNLGMLGIELDAAVKASSIPEGQKMNVGILVAALRNAGASERCIEGLIGRIEQIAKKDEARAHAFTAAVGALASNPYFGVRGMNRITYWKVERFLNACYDNSAEELFSNFTYLMCNPSFRPRMLSMVRLTRLQGLFRAVGAEEGKNVEIGGIGPIVLQPHFLEMMEKIKGNVEKAKKFPKAAVEKGPEALLNIAYGISVLGEGGARKLYEEFGIENFLRYSPKVLKELAANMEGGKKEKPVLLMVSNKADYNGAFYIGGEDREKLLKGYRVFVVEVETDEEFHERVKAFAAKYGKINTLVLSGHGEAGEIQLGVDKENGSLDLNDREKLEYLREYFDRSSGTPKVVINGCSTAKGELSIAKFLSEIWGTTTFAPMEPTRGVDYHFDEKGEIIGATYSRRPVFFWGEKSWKSIPAKKHLEGKLQEIYAKRQL